MACGGGFGEGGGGGGGGVRGYGFLFRSEFCFRTIQELEYYFFVTQFFFPEFNIR